ncbi:MAG: glycosyltransferase [Acidobacteriota bacterium]
MRIALLTLGDEAPSRWSEGPSASCAARPDRIAEAATSLLEEGAPWIACWDVRLPAPEPELLRRLAHRPEDAWHAGLLLGQSARPALIDRVHPTWMLNLDPPADRTASSWRLSLRACLVRAAAWARLGGPDDGFRSLDAAALELGHRWLWGGALIRHEPRLLSGGAGAPGLEVHDLELPMADQLRFLRRRCGRFWTAWAAGRELLGGRTAPLRKLAAGGGAPSVASPLPGRLEPRDRAPRGEDRGPEKEPRVSVLIPTLDRYPYLEVVLRQLAGQTVPPHQVIVIDQTAAERRRRGDDLCPEALPCTVLERDRPGQSSARNAGLQRVTGDVVLFLDDDVEIEPDLIAGHLATLRRWGADASCGVAEETGAGPLPQEFRLLRTSDVFPTCNAAVRREALERSGLFDLAFDHGSRADADLGTRLYLSGALMVLDPELSVIHHKAPAGGLREHRARVITYAASRRRAWARHLPSATEIYLAKRYFAARQAREMLWMRVAGTLRARGGLRRQALKLLAGLLTLPDSLARVAARARRAESMLLEGYPVIPRLEAPAGLEESRTQGAGDGDAISRAGLDPGRGA